MRTQINITELRKKLLSLPETLAQGETLEVLRHEKVVLKLTRASSTSPAHPFEILEQARTSLQKKKLKKNPPADLSKNYKQYLYGKKK